MEFVEHMFAFSPNGKEAELSCSVRLISSTLNQLRLQVCFKVRWKGLGGRGGELKWSKEERVKGRLKGIVKESLHLCRRLRSLHVLVRAPRMPVCKRAPQVQRAKQRLLYIYIYKYI